MSKLSSTKHIILVDFTKIVPVKSEWISMKANYFFSCKSLVEVEMVDLIQQLNCLTGLPA